MKYPLFSLILCFPLILSGMEKTRTESPQRGPASPPMLKALLAAKTPGKADRARKIVVMSPATSASSSRAPSCTSSPASSQASTPVQSPAGSRKGSGKKKGSHKVLLAQRPKKKSMFTVAASKGLVSIVKEIFSQERDAHGEPALSALVNETDDQGRTALHHFAQQGMTEGIKFLLVHHALTYLTDKFHQTPLHLAASQGHAACVALLLEKGQDLALRDNKKRTALHCAVNAQSAETVKLLLEAGAEVNVQDDDLCTPLHAASLKGDLSTVTLLLERGAALLVQDNAGRTASHCAAYKAMMSLESADAREQYCSVMKLLFNKGAALEKERGEPVICEARDHEMRTPLHYACSCGFLEAVACLLDSGVSLSVTDSQGETPLHAASYRNREALKKSGGYLGHVQVVKLLIEKEVCLDAQDLAGQTALHYAGLSESTRVVALLLDAGADETLADNRHVRPIDLPTVRDLVAQRNAFAHSRGAGWTKVHQAAYLGLPKKLKKLIAAKDTDLSSKTEEDGFTPLHCAAFQGHSEILRMLCEAGVSPHARSKKGETALHIAVSARHSDAVRILLAQGAQVNAQTVLQQTALHCAVQDESSEITEILIAAGAFLEPPDQEGNTPLHLATLKGNYPMVALLLKKGVVCNPANNDGITPRALARTGKLSDLEQLLRAAEIEAKNRHELLKHEELIFGEFTPLQRAALDGKLDLVCQLLDVEEHDISSLPSLESVCPDRFFAVPLCIEGEEDKDLASWVLITKLIDAAYKHGLSPLHYASWSGHAPVVTELLKRGALYDVRDDHDQTPLHLAALGGHTACVELLCEQGADMSAQDFSGMTPLHIAAIKGHEEIVAYLLRQGVWAGFHDRAGLTALRHAVGNGHAKVVSQLLFTEALEKKDSRGKTLLHYASQEGHVEVVRMLIALGADCDSVDTQERTPLFLACERGHEAVVAELLTPPKKLDPRKVAHLLVRAAHEGYAGIVKRLLLKGAHPDLGDSTLSTPLHHAVLGGHRDCVDVLLDQGASVTLVDYKGWTPLHHAAYVGQKDIVALLRKRGALLTQSLPCGAHGWTPVHCAVAGNAQEVLELFLRDSEGMCFGDDPRTSPLSVAFAQGNMKVVTLLLAWYAEHSAADECTDTELYRAVIRGDVARLFSYGSSGAELASSSLSLSKRYSAKGPLKVVSQKENVNFVSRDTCGFTPLHWAAYLGHTELVVALLQRDKKLLNEVDAYGMSALHCACLYKELRLDVVVMLLQRGARLDQRDVFGRTPLHIAAMRNHRELLGLLIEKSPQLLDLQDAQGRTPLDWALLKGHKSSIECLKEHLLNHREKI